jgi:AcrR family transcriptional regulator
MARKATRSKARSSATEGGVTSGKTPRERAVAAFMNLLAEKPIEQIGLTDIATAADLSLADLRGEFSSTLSILAAFMKDIDRRVLAGGESEMEEETARERLFDVLMRRLELLAPYKEAVHSLMRSARRNPGLGLALNAMAVRSQQWMLAAAGIGSSGPKGMVRAQGLALLFANVLRTWVRDDDEGLARTLAALDRELARGQRLAGLLDEVCGISERACSLLRRVRRPRRRRDDDEEAVAA